MAKEKKVPLNRIVKPETFERVKALALEMGESEGAVIDLAVRAYRGGGEVGHSEGVSVDVAPLLRAVYENSDKSDEVLELLRSLPETFMEAMDRYKARKGTSSQIPSTFQPQTGAREAEQVSHETAGFDPRSIPGVSVGLPPKVAGTFPCRCVHSGCRGSKFMGRTKFASLCDDCTEAGHRGEPRDCKECANDMGAI